MLICVYIQYIKRYYCIVYLVLFSMPMYFYVVFFSFVFLLLLSDFNMFDVPYSWHVSGASRPLSFVRNKK